MNLSNFRKELEADTTFKTTEIRFFLDIERQTIDGFQLSGKLPKKDFVDIISRADNECAALKNETIDYL